jgi:hypothetical protein
LHLAEVDRENSEAGLRCQWPLRIGLTVKWWLPVSGRIHRAMVADAAKMLAT